MESMFEENKQATRENIAQLENSNASYMEQLKTSTGAYERCLKEVSLLEAEVRGKDGQLKETMDFNKKSMTVTAKLSEVTHY